MSDVYCWRSSTTFNVFVNKLSAVCFFAVLKRKKFVSFDFDSNSIYFLTVADILYGSIRYHTHASHLTNCMPMYILLIYMRSRQNIIAKREKKSTEKLRQTHRVDGWGKNGSVDAFIRIIFFLEKHAYLRKIVCA